MQLAQRFCLFCAVCMSFVGPVSVSVTQPSTDQNAMLRGAVYLPVQTVWFRTSAIEYSQRFWWLDFRTGLGPALRVHRGLRISVLLPNRLAIRSTATLAVWFWMSSAGLSSITSKLPKHPVSAIISMHS